jgi:cation:H+ antiporter
VPLTTAVIQFMLSAFAIIVAGTMLTRAADRIAAHTRLGRLFVGSIFIAAATSLPELTVNIAAVQQQRPDMAVGNLFGSSILNLLILGIADMIHTRRGLMFSRESVAHALAATQSIALTALAALGIVIAPFITGWHVFGISYGTLFILLAYVFGLRLVFRDERYSQRERPPEDDIREARDAASRRKAFVRSGLAYAGSALILIVAAPYLSTSAGRIAEISGLSDTFFGTTMIALCTSLPELVSCFAAVRMGAFDLALGNIFGSNAFNMVLLIPMDFVSGKPLLQQVSQTHLLTALASIIITAVAVMGQLYQVEKRRTLIEPDALLVILMSLGTLAGIYAIGG